MMLVLVVANGPAVAAAICQHQDVRVHAAALQSGDAGVAAEALDEESAAKAASTQGALGDAAATLLAGCMLPHAPELPRPDIGAACTGSADPPVLGSRTVPPLLEPPLA
ncbi:hypothetical protein [Sphingosinicella rhizophila]|uniref:Uncharacterized protein n=1 Tax=Sphingosinicella rhizophila TaxID=3050082 RepID=A0ABU3Q1Q8_9SPHN|nr:hypothetical protein [Sphingosinicella sp. GR2756]MDT9597360.1 hypothetical protein [Sphingosinicella sp. GR2756]